jgi:endonuclease/exonuclease/phosphatase family metal-dependent hydrolase
MLSGQSIMSQFPIENHERIVLKKPESNPFYYNAFYINRLAQIAIIKHPVKDICVINIHVEAYDKKTRRSQLKIIHKLCKQKQKEMPVLLIGDFNSSITYKDAAINMFLKDTNLACAGLAEISTEFTFSSDEPFERIDFIFYSKKDFEEIESSVLKEFGEISDHLPFYTKLKIK